jgi:hypothetical protein
MAVATAPLHAEEARRSLRLVRPPLDVDAVAAAWELAFEAAERALAAAGPVLTAQELCVRRTGCNSSVGGRRPSCPASQFAKSPDGSAWCARSPPKERDCRSQAPAATTACPANANGRGRSLIRFSSCLQGGAERWS